MTSNKTIKATPNHSKRTFTLRTSTGVKYRTLAMDLDEFRASLNNTQNDWNQFLKSDDYYEVN